MNYLQFLDEFRNLNQRYPVLSTHVLRSENCDLGDYLASCHNAIYSFDDAQCKDILYLCDSFKAVNCYDGDYVVESENCYECVDIVKSYNCTFLNYCTRMVDSNFCHYCDDSDHLFGCVYLKYKKFCIFNRQYSEDEYNRKVQELLQRPAEQNIIEMEQLSKQFPVTVTHVNNSENCDYGNQIFYSRNLYLCFDCAHSEEGGYQYDAHYNKSCYDLTQTFHCEYCYECVDCARLNNCSFMVNCEDMFDSAFCENCANSHHLFGCCSLDKKQFCILNRQYSETEYKEKIKKIIDSFQMIGSGKNSAVDFTPLS